MEFILVITNTHSQIYILKECRGQKGIQTKKFAESQTKHSVRSHNKMLKMRYFGHVMRAHQSLEKYIMLGITGGAREKGKPRMRWMDVIKSVTGLSVNDLNQFVKDRKKWCSLVYIIVPMFNPRRRQRQTTALRMLPSTSARITRSLKDFILDLLYIVSISFSTFLDFVSPQVNFHILVLFSSHSF